MTPDPPVDRLPEDDFDRRLTEALQRASLPATPTTVFGRVHRLMGCRRQQFMVLGVASAAAFLLCIYIAYDWYNSPTAPPPPGKVQLARQPGKLEGLNLLVSGPPVVNVTSEQDRRLALLEQETEGNPR